MVLWIIAAAIAVAAVAQAIRIGLKRGDWSGLLPLVIIGALWGIIALVALASSGR